MMIGLCIEEMGMNIIRYGFFEDDRTHFLDIRAIVREEQCVIHFRDNCVSFAPVKYLELYKDVNPAAHIGIRMIMKTVKDANYVNSFGLNNLALII